MVFISGRILGEGAVAPTKHLITRLEPGRVFANRFDTASDVHPQRGDLWFAQPESGNNEANHVRKAGHHMPDAAIQASRMHAHQYLIIGGHRLRDLPQLEYLNAAVLILGDGLHADLQ